MNITWFKDDTKPGQATLCESNITLNKIAIKNFEGFDSVLLGIDYPGKKIVIKPCKSNTPHSFKISIAPSYGRITNKEFMKEITKILDCSLTNPLKLETEWNSNDEILIINLKSKGGK